jgi:hypothetical protein
MLRQPYILQIQHLEHNVSILKSRDTITLRRFDISVNSNGGVHSLLLCISCTWGSPFFRYASLQENIYYAKYQNTDMVYIYNFLAGNDTYCTSTVQS